MTPKPVLLRRQAKHDVDAALNRYLIEASEAVALNFVDALAAAFAHIAGQPASGSPRYAQELDLAGLRAWPITGFPYLVFYMRGADSIDVWRILHGQRDMAAWLRME